MSKKTLLTIFAVVIISLGLGYIIQTIPQESEIIKVEMNSNTGTSLGFIDLVETKAGVMLRLDLQGLKANGEQAIHIHETGKCTPEDSFKDAGGHYNPQDKSHGMKHPEGQHAGDMPNLKADKEGVIKTQFLNKFVTLHGHAHGKRATLFDDDGSAIVIHEGADDHISQPSGAAGGRFACGVISKD